MAITDLLAQDGTVYKRDEAEKIQAAIERFRDDTGLITPEPEPPTQESLDRFFDMISNAKGYQPPTPEEQAELDKMVEELRASGMIPPLED